MIFPCHSKHLLMQLQAAEISLIATLSEKFLIKNALAVGPTEPWLLLKHCRCSCRYALCEKYCVSTNPTHLAIGYFTHFPYANESMDFIVLSHAFHETAQTESMLKEAIYCLNAGGILTLFTSSPSSLKKLRHLMKEDLEIIDSYAFCSFFASIPNNKLAELAEKYLVRLLPFLGRAYCIVAKKIQLPSTPIPANSLAKKPDFALACANCQDETPC